MERMISETLLVALDWSLLFLSWFLVFGEGTPHYRYSYRYSRVHEIQHLHEPSFAICLS